MFLFVFPYAAFYVLPAFLPHIFIVQTFKGTSCSFRTEKADGCSGFDVILLTLRVWSSLLVGSHSPVAPLADRRCMKSSRVPSRVQHLHPAGEVRCFLRKCQWESSVSLSQFWWSHCLPMTWCSVQVNTFREDSCWEDQRFSTCSFSCS